MIVGEFAINPDAIKNWSDLKNITMNFGFHNGAIISDFPNTWIRELKQKAKDELEGTRQYLDIIERLDHIKSGYIIKRMREYDNEHTWLDNALKENSGFAFYKIVNDADVANEPKIISFEKLDEKVFSDLREGVISRHAEDIASVAALILECSKNIKIIDPYFSSHRGYKNTINEIFKLLAYNRKQNVEVEVHASFMQGGRQVNIESEKEKLIRYFSRVIPKEKQLTVMWWNDNDTKELHPRYLLSERAGIRYDRGFLEPSELSERDTKTDVSMMSKKMADDVWNKYRAETSAFKVVDKQIIQGEKSV